MRAFGLDAAIRYGPRGMFVFKAAVVGAGTMGAEIAHVIASAGIPVVLKDTDRDRVRRGRGPGPVVVAGPGRRGQARATELERRAQLITPATGYERFGDVDLVIEAVPEQMELKHAVFSELDEVTPGHAILASNTSALSITEIGQATIRPDKVVGLHFFFPASVSRLVEVVEGEDTSTETAQATATFAQAIRKAPIRCADAPGFVVNRILNAAVSELWRAQEESGADLETFDRADRRGVAVAAWARSSSPTCSASTRWSRSPSTCASPTATDSTCTRRCAPTSQAGRLGAKTGQGLL